VADRKISDLTALTTPATGDLIPIVDISEAAAADKNKSITVGELLRGAPDGTAAAPGFAFESDGGNGMFLGGTDILAFSTGGSQAVTIDASQRVGLGTTSPVTALDVRGEVSVAYDANYGLRFYNEDRTNWSSIANQIATGSTQANLVFKSGTGTMVYDNSGRLGIGTSPNDTSGFGNALDVNGTTGSAVYVRTNASATDFGLIGHYGTSFYVNNNSNGSTLFFTNGNERARIDSSGRLFVGCTSNVGVNTTRVDIQAVGGGAEYGLGIDLVTLNAGTQWIEFSGGGTGNRGNIDWSGTTVRYNTTSDYRLKENIVPLVDSISRIKKLKPCRYRLIEFPDQTVDGFIAHEAQIAVPEAVTGEKDAVDDDGNPVYQGIDQSKLVPLLTAALQEALAKIETLEQRLTDAGIA